MKKLKFSLTQKAGDCQSQNTRMFVWEIRNIYFFQLSSFKKKINKLPSEGCTFSILQQHPFLNEKKNVNENFMDKTRNKYFQRLED